MLTCVGEGEGGEREMGVNLCGGGRGGEREMGVN